MPPRILLCGLIAAEIGADIEVVKAGGLLHDIGKAMTHEVQGSHVDIGGDIAEKYGIPYFDNYHQMLSEVKDINIVTIRRNKIEIPRLSK